MRPIHEKYDLILVFGLFLWGSVFINGCIQKETASGSVSTGKMDNIIPLSTPVPSVVTTPIAESDNPINGTPPVSSFYFTNLNISYEEMKRLEKNYTPPSPIPESEMARIIFSKTWFMQHDEDPRTSHVRLTFPVTWLDKPPVSDNEPVILLRVPKSALELNDVNPDPEMLNVSYTAERFKEFPNMTAVNLT